MSLFHIQVYSIKHVRSVILVIFNIKMNVCLKMQWDLIVQAVILVSLMGVHNVG